MKVDRSIHMGARPYRRGLPRQEEIIKGLEDGHGIPVITSGAPGGGVEGPRVKGWWGCILGMRPIGNQPLIFAGGL
jgi:hypothetical protein